MCTAVSFKNKYTYFGRNLDMECSYDEKVIITPRNYPFKFKHLREIQNHLAMIGIGIYCAKKLNNEIPITVMQDLENGSELLLLEKHLLQVKLKI